MRHITEEELAFRLSEGGKALLREVPRAPVVMPTAAIEAAIAKATAEILAANTDLMERICEEMRSSMSQMAPPQSPKKLHMAIQRDGSGDLAGAVITVIE